MTPSATATLPVHRFGLLADFRKITGAVFHPKETWKWMQLLRTHPLLSELIEISPSLPQKIHRRYLSRQLNCAQRAALLETHYDIMLASGCSAMVKQAAIHPLPLCVFIGKSSIFYRLELSTAEDETNTGEMILRLTSRGLCIYTIAFTFNLEQGRRHITVGRLKGMLATNKSMNIKRVTRDLHGFRPKDLMVSLVQEIGAFFFCEKVILVSNRNKLRERQKPVCKKSSDYDRTWTELNACLRSDGNFELPCVSRLGQNRGIAHQAKKHTLLINSIHAALRRRLSSEQSDGYAADTAFRKRT